jgi:phosphate transport system substrate-binding protein
LVAAALALAATPALPALAAGDTQLNGSGATFPQPLYEDWAYAYNATKDSSLKINYSGGGSGQGKKDIIAGTVDFAGTDAALTDGEAKSKPMQQIPTVAGAVVMAFNVPGVKDLVLDGAVVSGIYLGKIAKWNDPAIAALNPGAALPNLNIIVVHRSDGSGTTSIFTTYLTGVSADWRATVKPPASTTVDWPVDKLGRGLGAKGNPGVAATVQKTKGAIGYMELSYAINNKIAYSKMINAAGKTVAATLASTTAALKTAWFDDRMAATIVNSSQPDAWPIAGLTYLIVNKDYKDCAKATKLLQWIAWGVASPEGQARATALLYSPLPAEVMPRVQSAILSITCNGAPVFK